MGKKSIWIYRCENDALYPIFEVGKESRKLLFEINNPIESIYTFCKIGVENDGDFDIEDTYILQVPGNEEEYMMNMYISNEQGSPFVYVVVKNQLGVKIVENNYLVGEPNIVEDYIQPNDLTVVSGGDCESLSQIEMESSYIQREEFNNALLELENMPGLAEIKEEVNKLVECVQVEKYRKSMGLPALNISHHLVFTGNPGTGKTTVARLLGKIYAELGVIGCDKVVEIDRSGLVEGYVGQTAIKTKKVIESAMGGILYIDEAYTLAKDGNDFGQEAIDTLLKEMEDHRDDLIVIVAGYEDQMSKFIYSNPGLKSRFRTFINFQDYSGEELYEIFDNLCKKSNMQVEQEALPDLKDYFMQIARNKSPHFANGREVRNYFEKVVCCQAHRISIEKNPTINMLSMITCEDLEIHNNNETQTQVINELMSMTGLDRVKKEMQAILAMIKIQKAREEQGLKTDKLSYHMVFSGNPGTGKTTVARIVAKILNSIGVIAEDKLVEVDSSMLIAGYTGQTAIKTMDVINRAIGGVLFIDEAYTLERSVGGFGQEAIDTLLKAMEDYRDNLVVIVAGYEKEMQRFIASNPGLKSRFSNYIYFEDYSATELFSIFKKCCEKEQYKMDLDAERLLQEYIGNNKKQFSGNGRDIRNLFEKMKKEQANRLQDEEYSLKELMLVTRDDIEEIIKKRK